MMLPLLRTSPFLSTLTSCVLLLSPVHGDNINNQFPDPIDNLISTYGEDLVPGYSQLSASEAVPEAAAAPMMSGIDMLRMAVPGTPGEDYPIYAKIPDTSFNCEGRIEGGYYADTEARCQPFHICTADGSGSLSKYSFLCPNGTLFNQEYFVCEYWFNVDCSKTESLYVLNEGIGDTNSGAASSPVGGFAPPAEPEDESLFLSSPVANELDETASNSSPESASYDAPDSAASAPLSSYEPTIDSYGAPSADVAPLPSYAPQQPQYSSAAPIRTGRKQRPKNKPAARKPRPFNKPPPRPKAPANRGRPNNQPRGGRTQFNEAKRPSSKLPIAAPVHRQPSILQFKQPKPFLNPIKPRQEPRGGRTQSVNSFPSAPAPAPAPPQLQTGYGAPPPLLAPTNEQPFDNSYNSPAPTYNEPIIEITTEAAAAPIEEYGPPPPQAPPQDYSFALSSPQGVEPPVEYEYEEEPLPTYIHSGSGDSNYVAPIVQEEPVVPALPAESPTYISVTSHNADYDDEDPLPTYNRDAVGTSGSSYNAPGSEGLYGAPPPVNVAPAVQTGYGAPPPDPVSVAAPPQVETGYGAPIPPLDEDPLPTYTGGVYIPSKPAVPQTGYGAPPPLPASNPVQEYDAPIVDETIELDDEPLATYSPSPVSSNSVDSYTAPGAIDSYGAPTLDSYGLPAVSPTPVTSYKAPKSYGGPPAASSVDSYAIPAAPSINSYESPAAPALDSYNLPAAPALDSYDTPAAPALDSYSIPAAPALDSYGLPAAPAIDSYSIPAAPALDSYDSPAAPALDSYDSPAAPALDSYDSPAAPALNSYESPAAPALNSYGPPPSFSPGSNSRPHNTVDRLPEYYKSEINLGLADPNDYPRIDPFLADYGKPHRAPIRPPPPPPPPSKRPPRRKPLPPLDTGYGVPAAPPLGLPSYKPKSDHRGGFKRSLFRVYGR
jgi:hypothetical protein